MFLFCCSFALLALAVNPIFAQSPEQQMPMMRPHHNMVDWVKKLQLNDEQKAAYNAIRQESEPQMQALRQQISTLRQQMENIYADNNKKLRAILDEKQAAKFDKIQARIAKQNRQPQPRAERQNRFKMRKKQ